MNAGRIKVLMAKPGLDGHDRGALVVVRALREAGMEVIYSGLRQTPEMIAARALQEKVDVVGISILSGAHMTLVPQVMKALKAGGGKNIKVFVGGIIPDRDVPRLKRLGVKGVYGPGTLTKTIIEAIRSSCA